MNIVVLAGGISTERDVSIVTGTLVCKALRERGHRAILMDVYFGLALDDAERKDTDKIFPLDYDVEKASDYIKSFNEDLEKWKKERREFFGENVIFICQAADVVFMALHGAEGENGKIQSAFDLFGIQYTGTDHLGSAMAMNKNITKKLLQYSGVPVPKGYMLKKGESVIMPCDKAIKYPCVVKVCCGGSSVGVYMVENDEQYRQALQQGFELEEEIMVEEYIKGREFSVGVIEEQVLPIIEICPKEGFYDYKNKYSAGMTDEICPAPISEELTKQIQEYAQMAANALMLHTYSRIDFLMDEKNQIYCLEANTLPGMTPTSLMPQEAGEAGMSYGELCERLIEVSLKK